MARANTVGYNSGGDQALNGSSEWPECYHVYPEEETFYTHSVLEAAIVTVLMPLIILLGTLGNACVVYAFVKQEKLRTVTNSYLVNLAVSDLVILLCAGPITVVQYATSPIPNDFSVLGPWSCKLVGYLVDTSLVVSCCTIVVVTAERYLAICWPVAFMSARHANSVPPTCAILWIAAALFKVPAAYFGSVEDVCLDWSQVSGKESYPSRVVTCQQCSRYHPGCPAYSKYIHFDQILPLLAVPVLAIFYALMVRRLTQRTSVAASRESTRRKRQVVQLLIMTGTVYLVCHSPFRVINFLNYYGYIGADSIAVCWQVGRLMLYANSAVNPAIYNASSEAYRSLFCKSFRLARCLPKGHQRSPEGLPGSCQQTGGKRTRTVCEVDDSSSVPTRPNGSDARWGCGEGVEAAEKAGGKRSKADNNNGVLENGKLKRGSQERRHWNLLDKYKAHLKVPPVVYMAVDTEAPSQSISVTPTSEVSSCQSKESVV